MKQILNFIVASPKLVIGFLFLVTLFFILGLTKIEINNNQDATLPADDVIVKGIDEIENVFGDKTMILIGLQTEDVYNINTLKKVKDISKSLEEVDFIIKDEINSIATVNNVKGTGDNVDIGPFMDEIPLNTKELNELKENVLSNDIINEQLVSKDGSLIVIAAGVKDGYDQGKFYNDIHELVTKYNTGPETIHTTGEPILLQDIELGIKADSDRIVPIAVLVVFLGIFFFFRRIRATLLIIISAIMSIIWTLGLMGHIGLPMTVVTNALPILLVVVASSYGIHILFSYYENVNEESSKSEVVIKAVQGIGGPVVMTGITTGICTFSLIVFQVTTMREFGIIAGIGIFFATFISLTFIPAMLSLLKKQTAKTRNNSWLNKLILWITNFSIKQKWGVLAFYAVVFGFSLYGISKIIVGEDFIRFFPKDHKGRIDSEVFNDKLSGVRVMDLMIDTKEIDGIKEPDFFYKLTEFQNYLETVSGIGNTFSYTDLVSELKDAIGYKSNAALSKEGIAQYLLLYSMSADPGDFNNIVDDDYQKTKLQIMLKTSEPNDHRAIYNDAKNYFAANFSNNESVHFGGETMLWIAQIGYIVKGKFSNIIISLLVTLLLCSLFFRSISGGVFCVVPIILSVLQIFGIMSLLGIRLEIATSMLTAISVGIGIDFALHYLSGVKKNKHLGESASILSTAQSAGNAISYDALSNMFGFAICGISGFIPLQNFGLLLALSMAVICFNTLFLLPAMLKIFKPKSYVLATSN